jgi:hypothetical protein
MFWPSAIFARQWEVKHVSVDIPDSPTILDACMATKNGRPQQQHGQYLLLGLPGVT